MALERRLSRAMFEETEIVELRQVCFTPGRLFEPGKYLVGDLPDTAFEMGLVDKLPPVREKGEETEPEGNSGEPSYPLEKSWVNEPVQTSRYYVDAPKE